MKRCSVCQVWGWGRKYVSVLLRSGHSWDVLVCGECEHTLENKIK
jgi:hypothetical protein